ncbi:predicted protein [Heterostelium album PN500]|uniref:BTB domain-containing protein n=1 Tax=Heterostelium pallidum (strain ATCC 26659 / Pp 5 / PN500) TaxID=670386 RepID=D3BA72_HETP5|nr:predicted protein [Heterostelium album PN500]EFA81459.1 predicted protein [Heterostelium album PN500]|eukprot:XP_020433577.1 predicted protein [Heterostelium album PN500]
MDNYLQFFNHFVETNYSSNEELIEKLKSKYSIDNLEVIDALITIPRGDFIPEELTEQAYHDSPIRCSRLGFNISAPHIYINCLAELDIKPGNKFLDIGSGCGHFTCLAGYLVGPYGQSHGLEISEEILNFGRDNQIRFSNKSGIDLSNVEFKLRNCFLPDRDDILYDRIYVGSACPKKMMARILDRLAPNGILIIPISDELRKYTKDEKGEYTKTTLLGVRYSELQIPTDQEIENANFLVERERKLEIKIPSENLSKSFGNLVNSELDSDIIFMVMADEKQRKINAHKLFLRVRAPKYFESIEEQSVIELPIELDYESVMIVMNYMYCGEEPMEVINQKAVLAFRERLSSVVLVCQYFEQLELLAYCQELLELYKEVQSDSDKLTMVTPKTKHHFEQLRCTAKRTLQTQMLELSTSSLNSDITLSVGGSKIKCHKLILKSRSKFFKSFFTSGMKETFSDMIEIHGPFDLSSFIEYIRFVYSGDKSIINSDNVIDLMCVSDYFNDNCLKSLCEEFLVGVLDSSNVSSFLQASSNYNALQLKAVCMEKIFEEFDTVSKMESFKQLDKDLIVNCLSECCQYFKKVVNKQPVGTGTGTSVPTSPLF